MSCDPDLLESLIDGTLGPNEHLAAQAHLSRCARCEHELRWLRSERALFAQRAHRAVAEPVVGPRPARKRDSWRQVPFAALAACFALVVLWRPSASGPGGFESVSESALMSVSSHSGDPELLDVQQRFAACLIATPGAGSACEPLPLPASFGR